MRRATPTLAVAVSVVMVAAVHVEGGTIFSETQTGSQLFSNPDVSFPTVTPTVNGSSLDFGTGAAADILMRWDLLPAEARGGLTFTVTIDYTRLTVDSDPFFLLADASRYQGVNRSDNASGASNVASGTYTATSRATVSELSTFASVIDPLEPFTFVLNVADGGSGLTR